MWGQLLLLQELSHVKFQVACETVIATWCVRSEKCEFRLLRCSCHSDRVNTASVDQVRPLPQSFWAHELLGLYQGSAFGTWIRYPSPGDLVYKQSLLQYDWGRQNPRPAFLTRLLGGTHIPTLLSLQAVKTVIYPWRSEDLEPFSCLILSHFVIQLWFSLLSFPIFEIHSL